MLHCHCGHIHEVTCAYTSPQGNGGHPISAPLGILAAADVDRSISALDNIASALSRRVDDILSHGPSLAAGACGIAVFFEYLSRSGLLPSYDGLAQGFLDTAVESASSQPLPLDLYGGIFGLAWTIWHLAGTGASYASEIDTSLLRDGLRSVVSQSPPFEQHDLMRGLVGFGAAAIEDVEGALEAHHTISIVAERLIESATPSGTGLTWETDASMLPAISRTIFPPVHVNLGLAHGVPGVLVALAAASAVGNTRALESVHPTAEWILTCDLGMEEGHFPVFWPPDDRRSLARSAWCYGDPGVASSFYVAGQYSNNQALREIGMRIAATAAHRLGPSARVFDAGLCHGSAGLAHIFRRWFEWTGDERFAKAALHWYRTTLDYQRPGMGIGGFTAQMDESHHASHVGLLTGAAGVGLALLASVADQDPAWDRLLLLSHRQFCGERSSHADADSGSVVRASSRDWGD